MTHQLARDSVPAPLPPEEGAGAEAGTTPPLVTRDIRTGGLSIRQFAARGTIVNTFFTVVLSLLSLLRGFILAAFLTRAEYGVWGLLAVSLGTLLWLKQVGIGDKYIQQDDLDQELAFQKAFTLEVIFTGIFMVILAIALPVFALVYGEPSIIAPGIVILLVLPAGALQAPLWVYYRNMDFVKQRLLQAIDPLVGFVVAIALAVSGAGYWALAGGVLAGAWASSIAVLWKAPYALRFRYDRGTMRSYLGFSWPLFISNGSSLVIAQSAVIVAQRHLGLGAVGAMSLSSTIGSFTQRIDGLITGTLYPAICAVKDRADLLEESFVKSNRLALMWAMPFGCALGLFVDDLVAFGIGERWKPAATLLEITGFNAALGHIAFNWDAYMRALGRTRPIAVASVVTMVVFVTTGIPLLIAFGLRGLAIGIVLQSAANMVVRVYYLRRLFSGFSYLRQAARSMLPTVPAIAIVLIARALETGPRSLMMAAAEVTVYAAVVGALTWWFERALLQEALGYLGNRRRPSTA